MRPTFTNGLLKGAALAIAGAAALGAGSAFASPTECSTVALGSLASPCTFGDFTYSFGNFTGVAASVLPSFTNDGFGIFSFGPTDLTGSTFDFTVATTSPRFFTSSVFTNFQGNNSISAIPLLPGTYAPFNTTSISGTYTLGSAILSPSIFGSQSTATFTTDVPVPLPIVGAGLAFGFTRKLRRRAKAVA